MEDEALGDWADDPDDGSVPDSFGWASAQDVATEAQIQLAQATARLWGSLADALQEARRDPAAWVPMRPEQQAGFRERDLAVRACVADLAIRLHLTDSAVRSWAHLADRSRSRLPLVWSEFRDGLVSPQHLRAALDASDGLDEEAVARFDLGAAQLSTAGLTVGRFRQRLRRLAERIDGILLQERRRVAVEARGVWVEHVRDGMAWLTAHLPSEEAARAMAMLDASAERLARADDETRTLDQLRADTLADLLTGAGTPNEVRAHVTVTVPVLSLLGMSDRPASLDGTVPIDPATARELCATAPSLRRILTDPIDSTVLDVDRRSYRPPADLDRLVRLRDRSCTRPGCDRPAERTDLDHVRAWADGGPTSAANLACLCRGCHRLKHETRWRVEGSDGRMTWTSPFDGRAHRTEADPP